ncbi:MAG: hypothetical protein QXE93_00720, partial [Candidatus Pacearchaeota archaeon]
MYYLKIISQDYGNIELQIGRTLSFVKDFLYYLNKRATPFFEKAELIAEENGKRRKICEISKKEKIKNIEE